MKNYLFVILLAITGAANATVIDFESGLDPLFNYTGVTTGSGFIAPSGYNTVSVFTGSSTLAFNPFEASPSTFSWAGAGTFDLTSFVIAGAWGSQTLTIESLLNNVVQDTVLLAVDFDVVDVFSPGWSGIDAFRITTGNDFVLSQQVQGSGQHWALDNLTINQNGSVPVSSPSTLLLIGLGLVGIGFARRKGS